MILTYAIMAVVGCLWLCRMIAEERVIFRRTYLDLPIALFVISQLISTVTSIHPYTSFFGYYNRFHGGLLSILTYVLLYYAVTSNVPRTQVPRLLLSTCLAAIGVSLYAIPEHFGRSPSCLLITGGQEFDVACWVQDVKNRVFGPFGQPNWLAAYAITIIPVQVALSIGSWNQLKAWQKSLYIVCSSGLFLTLIFTRSRSGLLGLAVAGGLFIAGLVGLWLKKRFNLSAVIAPLGITAVLFLTSMGIFGTISTPSLSQLLTPSSSAPAESAESLENPEIPAEAAPVVNRLDEGGTQSSEIRQIVWSGAVEVAKRYPLFGSGVETFAYSYYQDRPAVHNLVSEWDFLYNKAHNEFLNYLATTGIVGLSTYCLLLGWFLYKGIRLVFCEQHSAQTQLLVLGLITGVIALTVSNALGFSTVMVTILLFLYFALLELLRKPETKVVDTKTANKTQELQGTQYFGLSLTGIVALYSLWSILTMWTSDHAYAHGKLLLRSGQTTMGLDQLEMAIVQSPSEALYYDELGSTYAALAVEYANQNEATIAGQLAQAAILNSDKALELNPRHLNFHKTRARIFITLAQLRPEWLQNAAEALQTALALAPTDAKVMYNLALVQSALGDETTGFETLKKSIELKPNYESARAELAKYYETVGQPALAAEQYRYILEYITPSNQLIQQKLQQLEASQSGSLNQ